MRQPTEIAYQETLQLVDGKGPIGPDVARRLEAALRPLADQREVRDVVVCLLDRASLFSLAASWDQDREDLPLSRFAARVERWIALGVPELGVQLAADLGPSASKLGDLPERARRAALLDRASRASLFEENLAALRWRAPACAALLQECPSNVIAMRPNGTGLVLRDEGGAPTSLLAAPTTDEALAAARQLVERHVSSFEDVVVAGVNDGAALSILLTSREKQAADSGEDFVVWLIEPDASKVRAILEVLDLRAALARGALTIHTGHGFEESLRQSLEQPGAAMPAKTIGRDDAVETAIRRIIPELESWQEQRLMRAHERISAHAGETRKRWRAAGKGEPGLRFLLVATREDEETIAGIASTLERLGHETSTFLHARSSVRVARADVAERAAAFEADAIFAVDQVRTDISAAPDPIPFITLDTGPLGNAREALRKNVVGLHDHLLISAPEVAHSIGWPSAQTHSFPTVPKHGLVEAARSLGTDLEVVAEVGYIGHFTGTAEQNVELLRREHAREGAEVEGAISRAFELLSSHQGDQPPPPSRLLETFREGLGEPNFTDASRLYEQFLSQVAAPWLRLRTLERLDREGFALALFGAGWESHPILARHAKGRLVGEAELARGYLSTSVQLRISFGRALHPKLVDGAALGACMVVRRAPSDFIGRVRQETPDFCPPTRPAAMTDEEWSYLLEELAIRGDTHFYGSSPAALRAGLERAGIATDEVISPRVLDPISCAGDDELVLTIRRLLENPDLRRDVGRALQQEVETHLDAAKLLGRVLEDIAALEGARPSSMRPPPGFTVPQLALPKRPSKPARFL